jgi:hypothetical protein
MRLIGMMLLRNEDWVIRASLDAAFRWCDGVAVLLDRCTDETGQTIHDMVMARKMPMTVDRVDEGHEWNEMDLRQRLLNTARKFPGATHFAIIDGDEILTHNCLPIVKSWFEALKPGEALDVPMIAAWDDIRHHRVDDPTWSGAWLTLGFADQKDPKAMGWKAATDGYHHHNRPPFGVTGRVRRFSHAYGGVMHLQFANKRRLLAKHVLYRMVDHLRWPGREDVAKLNWKYDQALKPAGELAEIPAEWWGDYFKDFIYTDDEVPYQEAEIKRLLEVYGRSKFEGLDLKGF